ncbi:lytic murein transglycosylase [Idiomarina baltica]|jgi:membrane-bound lytic murein transglycosylase B|uniref:Lytic murein transglycosylase n=2 Tax=Idiomarina baltica TaxID=190892 RepID=A0A348WPR1_9GAMM|nr:lytic murein transglycosylase [Idiomarina baltica]MAF75999.1 lytic murein transglycosylase [Idiomarinaceae bacterium]MBR38136.1 lytic murein transglycosylase [Idiomarina sp.]MEC8924877.1 lytic murein transglycosylase [Pseudomonadota bacterium]EAQ31496.1 Membrane-bound lytic murein transglycosylase [Idiomarina baltica OS145]MBL74073.1 lytic murein transglycosylase [Idiomarinaceae bacterium]|tara:strand:- start:704 stop:1735 length:1032 start_codon:yes stop_codon:yes gene_type:complete
MKKLTLSTLALIVSASTVGFTGPVNASQSEQSSMSEQSESTEQKFQTYVDKLRSEALEQGYTKDTLDRAFAKVKYYQRAVELDNNQPEFKLTLDTYLPRAVPDWKAQKALEKYQEHKALLDEIGKKYGVQPRFIVALWGIETNFGSYTGGFDVVSALTTLAFDGRREAFFKKQLWQALTIIQDGHIDPEQMKGSWAGAMGQTQFMPSSFMSYAVDYDGDGKKDIWNSYGDVFASAANYLSSVGWRDDVTWGRQVQLPEQFDTSLAGLDTKKGLAEWQKLGITRMDGSPLPQRDDIEASVVIPDDKEGRVYLAYANYDALMRWNRSHYFVAAVGYLSDRIRFPR